MRKVRRLVMPRLRTSQHVSCVQSFAASGASLNKYVLHAIRITSAYYYSMLTAFTWSAKQVKEQGLQTLCSI